jgi:dTDP-4-amino-4,6-dideoxygalactose transaminase
MTLGGDTLTPEKERKHADVEPLVWPVFGDDEINAVRRVLASGRVNYWTGNECRTFECDFAAFVESRYAVAVANGSLALELALHAAGIGPGDEVVVPARSFVASASCVVVRGARPVFADVDTISQNVTADTIRESLTPQTRAVIVVHIAGFPCDMDPIVDLVRERGLVLIEDCAQALGARYRGHSVGSFGHVAAWSFCQDKILSTGGEGGMLTTNDAETWRAAWSYKDHGKNPEATSREGHTTGYRWIHDTPGTNLRMTEMQAAIGNVALPRVRDWIRRRRHLAGLLDDALSTVPAITLLRAPEDFEHAYYRYHVLVNLDQLKKGWDRDRVLRAVTELGTECYTGVCPEIYREKAFVDRGFAPADRLPGARYLADRTLMLQVYPTLSDSEILRAAAHVSQVFQDASR